MKKAIIILETLCFLIYVLGGVMAILDNNIWNREHYRIMYILLSMIVTTLYLPKIYDMYANQWNGGDDN